MPENTIASFAVTRLGILDERGHVDESLMPSLSDAQVVRMYELLVLTRAFDQRALDLQREGRIGTYPSGLGQEAAQVGSAFALKQTDWVFPSFREVGVHITLGYPLSLIYRYWGGDEWGQFCPSHLNILPICIAVGTHIPHAVGAAVAAKYQGDSVAAVCYMGDGATSKGDFHEGLNMAGALKAPVVFICQNNQWAISVSRKRQTASETLAQKAFAHGIAGVQVDGNDVFAVYRATSLALERARAGEGATFIECDTYRMADHTTADDASRYRNSEEMEKWRTKDPLLRLRLFLERKELWSDVHQAQTELKIKKLLDTVVQEAETADPGERSEIFTYTSSDLAPRQRKQQEEGAHAGS